MRAAQPQGLVTFRYARHGTEFGIYDEGRAIDSSQGVPGWYSLDPRKARTASTCTNSENLQEEAAARSGGLADADVDCNIAQHTKHHSQINSCTICGKNPSKTSTHHAARSRHACTLFALLGAEDAADDELAGTAVADDCGA